MEEGQNTVDNKIKEYPKGRTVHHVLAHSYLWYFTPLIIAVSLDLIYPVRIFHDRFAEALGFVFLFIATVIIFWAQNTSRKLDDKNVTKESFCKGPYCYTRTPTHWGLFILILSFGVILNAFFVIVFTFISFILTKVLFVKEHEKLLAEKYGAPYLEYKKSVKF